MAKVHITKVVVLDNPSPFLSPFRFEITFDCMEDLEDDLEWKRIYVGSADSPVYDQTHILYLGPVPMGSFTFVFESPAPNGDIIPERDALEVTVVLLACSYRGHEFVRIGYFVNNEYMESETELREHPPIQPQFDKVVRNILASEPRMTHVAINWDDPDDGPQYLPDDIPERDVDIVNNDSSGSYFCDPSRYDDSIDSSNSLLHL